MKAMVQLLNFFVFICIVIIYIKFEGGVSLSTSTVESPVTQHIGATVSIGEQRVCYRVLLEKGEDGWMVAKCLDVEGAISQGKSVDEALKNIIEAISAILEARGQIHEFLITWVEK